MRWLAIACVLMFAAGCASIPRGPEGVANPLPPIVLLLDDVAVEWSGIPSRSTFSTNTAKEVFWLSITALMTFGAPLLDLPNVIERGRAETADDRSCSESWKVVLNGPTSVLKAKDLRELAVDAIRSEAIRLISDRGQSVKVEIGRIAGSQRSRANVVGELRSQLSTPNLIVADVRVGVAGEAGCTARFRAIADVRHERLEAAGLWGGSETRPSVITVQGSEGFDVKLWAEQPEVGLAALQRALAQVAQVAQVAQTIVDA
jgi:hypothetical protein